ncbi:hypothetical protein BC835DRAFT_1417689 [Cytidiella melzeri]|nr:hypothetical protein BC835DRAFT_1417689 [Cytidiella melzeri]
MLRKTVLSAIPRRSFVSTVLLTRNWENETTNVLKREAKKRGLLQTGSKSTLVNRLQEFEREQSMQSGPTPVTQQQVLLSTPTEVPGIPSSSEPSPIPPNFPKEFLDVKIPDLYQPVPQRPVEIPFVPDFWESSRVKAESAPPPPPELTPVKVLAVAGAATHHGGGPSHNLYTPTSQTAAETTVKGDTSSASGSEAGGAWSLLGVLAGSWLVAGILAPTSAFASKEEVEGVDKASGRH